MNMGPYPPDHHRHLLSIVKYAALDYAPYGDDDRDLPNADGSGAHDCSCGCRFYRPLEGALGSDWGVCANPMSHRAGLLTFEHQGCRQFASDEDEGSA
jgi:hypothetical protein